MIGAAALLAVLDGAILSATPDVTRTGFALVVTILVGGAIIATWRSNTRLEKARAELEKNGGDPDTVKRAQTKRQQR